MVPPVPSDALQVLERWRQAAINRRVQDISSVYAVDAVHEFPFTRPGVPSRMEGRDEIVSFVVAFWDSGPLKYERYQTVAIHHTADPHTIVVEQEVEGTSSTTGPFILPNLVVLTARHGEIAHLRDYANVLAADEAIGV
jgi:ketosteroid isomerase-like protein